MRAGPARPGDGGARSLPAAGAGLGLARVSFRAAQGGSTNLPGCVAPTLRPLPAAVLLSAFLAAFMLSICSWVIASTRVWMPTAASSSGLFFKEHPYFIDLFIFLTSRLRVHCFA